MFKYLYFIVLVVLLFYYANFQDKHFLFVSTHKLKKRCVFHNTIYFNEQSKLKYLANLVINNLKI